MYWQDLAQETAKCHFRMAKAKLGSKLFSVVSQWNAHNYWTFKNILIAFHVEFEPDKI